MRRAILTDKLTGEKHACHATTDHPATAHGHAVWVDDETGVAYTQVDLPAIVEIPWTIEETRRYSDKQKTPETPAELLQLIRDTAKERGISAYRLALETGLVPNTVQRLFRDANDARLSQIMPILKYFGFEIRRRED